MYWPELAAATPAGGADPGAVGAIPSAASGAQGGTDGVTGEEARLSQPWSCSQPPPRRRSVARDLPWKTLMGSTKQGRGRRREDEKRRRRDRFGREACMIVCTQPVATLEKGTVERQVGCPSAHDRNRSTLPGAQVQDPKIPPRLPPRPFRIGVGCPPWSPSPASWTSRPSACLPLARTLHGQPIPPWP
jgi:hypothetical protein